MATTRPFAYNPTQTVISGTTNIGTLCVGDDSLDYSSNPGGLTWWMGPNEDPKYIIAKDYPAGNRPTPIGNIGTVFFKKSSKNDTAFINLVNRISGITQGNIQDSLDWLDTNGYWTSYAPGVITTGLRLYLDAGDSSSYPGTDTIWYDLSGNGNDVTMQNSGNIAWTQGGASYFSIGGNGWFSRLNGNNIPTGNSPYTLSAWVGLDSVWSAQGIMSIGSFGVGNQSNALRTGTTNQIIHYWWGNDISANSSLVNPNSWVNAVANFDGTTRKLFVNGVLIGSDTPTGHNVTNSNIQIAKTYSNEYLSAKMAQALIYDVALSDAEVLQNFNNSKSRFGL
jgi:hypothetical protein